MIKENRYLGKLCKRGHEFENTGKSVLRKDNSSCIVCVRMSSNRLYHCSMKDSGFRKNRALMSAKWKVEHHDNVIMSGSKYRDLNRDKLMLQAKLRRKRLPDSYIMEQLRKGGVATSKIPENALNVLINAKRMELLIRRKLREIKNGK